MVFRIARTVAIAIFVLAMTLGSNARAAAPNEIAPWHVVPAIDMAAYFYPNHPSRRFGASVAPSLDVWHDNGWLGGAAYRYTWGSKRNEWPSWDQHELHLDVGYATRTVAAILQYAVVDDRSGFSGISHHAGVSARWSPFGDVLLDTSLSDMTVFRTSPSWKIPIAWGLSIQPGVAMESAASQLHSNGSLAFALDRAWGSIQLGGKYGDEVRPAYLSARLITNTPESISWGVWTGGSWNAGHATRVSVSYAMNRLEYVGGSSNAYFVSWSISKYF